MIAIKRALVSVSDKTGVLDLCLALQESGAEILSTGGTAKTLAQNGIKVTEVSGYTGFPEMLDGRVKTLHPKIHGGLLALRDDPSHMETVFKHGIGLIDMVVVNLYPFEKTVAKRGVSREEAIENIDIGGPAMLRSAAKNHRSVVVVSNPGQYDEIREELRRNGGAISEETAASCAAEVFRRTSEYDAAIHAYLRPQSGEGFPARVQQSFVKIQDLRYGENPHQKAAFYADEGPATGLASMKQLWGKELSFNNILDLNAAAGIVKEFTSPAVVFVKHNNPCGVSQNENLLRAYREAWKCDQLSAFGGIVGANRPVDEKLAALINASGFLECVIAPSFSAKALRILRMKKNVRLVELPAADDSRAWDLKRVRGGILIQDQDSLTLDPAALTVVTRKKPSKNDMSSLLFGWKVAKHVKSNAIILSRGTRTVGIGAGQMSRVDSVMIARRKAGVLTERSCLASDAFFPKEDAIREAAKMGVRAIIQPGGSIADKEIIKACDRASIAMVFTGIRHFRH